MRYRLPPLNALRAFEAVTRCGGLAAAARELCITPSAVSRQIALLEGHFRTPLFVRDGRGLVPTPKARSYFQSVCQAFEKIDRASAAFGGRPLSRRLSVHTYSTFAVEWLIHRLPSFRARHPDIELRLSTSTNPVDLDAEDVDIGLAIAAEPRPDLRIDTLYDLPYLPVCAPGLLGGSPLPLASPHELRNYPLLYTRYKLFYWRDWLRIAGADDLDIERGICFDSSSLTYRAAREGAGIALADLLFVADDLADGTLVAPFGALVSSDVRLCLVSRARRADEPGIAAFRQWLLDEIGVSQAHARTVIDELGRGEAPPAAPLHRGQPGAGMVSPAYA